MQNEKLFSVYYAGRATRFNGFETEIWAQNAKEAVLKVCNNLIDLFIQDDGVVLDCDGDVISKPHWDFIKHDGGTFSADTIDF